MSFLNAIDICLGKYFGFGGRATRSEFWWFILFGILVGFVADLVDGALGFAFADGTGLFNALTTLGLLLPTLAVGARRLHDSGRSGWWQVLWLVVFFGWIVLLVLYCLDGESGNNQHGPNPKGYGGRQAQPGWA